MSALTDDAGFELHDLSEGDVRLDPVWRELLGLPPLAPQQAVAVTLQINGHTVIIPGGSGLR